MHSWTYDLAMKAESHEDYASKLKGRFAFAYDAASKEAVRNAARQKFHYDLQVQHASLEPVDRVLVRNVGLKVKHKLADHCEQSIHCEATAYGKHSSV